MLIIGLTGGIASGKSAVAEELAALGAVVLDADKAAHEVINFPEVKKALTERWGNEILLPDGNVDRKAVAERVFSTHKLALVERKFLEKILHSRIKDEFEYHLTQLKVAKTPVAVIDAPLLLEAGWQQGCDIVLFVDSPLEDRQQRAKSSRNWTAQDFATREAAQMPIEEKRRRATHVIANDGTLDELRERVEKFWKSLSLPK
jgi:dephospho-CoA kinase